MKTKCEQLGQIHLSLVNGQRRQMVNQIDEYGLYDFFDDYEEYLKGMYANVEVQYEYFVDCTQSYFRIKER